MMRDILKERDPEQINYIWNNEIKTEKKIL